MIDGLRSDIVMLDQELKLQRQAGITHEIAYKGKPLYRVTSLDPLTYKPFGVFRNKAPELAGPVAVERLLVVQGVFDPNLVNPGMVFDVQEQERDELFATVLSPEQYRTLGRSLRSI